MIRLFVCFQLEFVENEYFENNIRVNQYALIKNIQKIDKMVK